MSLTDRASSHRPVSRRLSPARVHRRTRHIPFEPLESRTLFASYEVFASTADRAVRSDGSMPWVGDTLARVGDNGTNTTEQVMIIPFALPAITGTITAASLSVYLDSIANASGVNGGVDVYGLGWRSADTVLAGDYFVGAYGTDSTDATPIQTNLALNNTSTGTLTTNASSAIVNYINAQIAAGAQAGDFIFFRLNAQVSQGLARYWSFRTANTSGTASDPKLSITTASGTVRYVGADPDNNGDGTLGNPYGTLNAAYQASSQGDQIHVLTGTYANQLISPRSSALSWTQNVVIKAAAGASPVFAGIEVKAPHITLSGLTINGFLAARQEGPYFRLENSILNHGSTVQSDYAEIINNDFRGAPNIDGMQIKPGNGISPTGILVEGNYIHGYYFQAIEGQPNAHVDAIQVLGAYDLVIRRNRIVHDGNAQGIQLQASIGPINNVRFENNFIDYGPLTVGGTLMNLADTNATNVTLMNNTIMGTLWVGGADKIIRNNIVRKLSKATNQPAPTHDHNYVMEITGMTLHSTEILGAQPKFIDRPNMDLRLVLVNGSPVDINNNPIDLSFGVSSGAPTIDFEGENRDPNDIWVGADEE